LRKRIKLRVNGHEHILSVPAHRSLLEVLREDLHLTGAKEGCGLGECGTCTVLIDGKATYACLTLALDASGKEITTIEGLEKNGRLHPLQESFVQRWAFQCGFCTPGMILSAKALLDENPSPSEDEVRRAIEGNFCRCTGFKKPVEAILAVAKKPE
jgi:aerobic carbon-monoxide dehydrogenase small subunit